MIGQTLNSLEVGLIMENRAGSLYILIYLTVNFPVLACKVSILTQNWEINMTDPCYGS